MPAALLYRSRLRRRVGLCADRGWHDAHPSGNEQPTRRDGMLRFARQSTLHRKGVPMTQTAATDVLPHIDATRQDCITDEQARFFQDNGLLVIRKVLRGAELEAMQRQTLPLVQRAARERPSDPDYGYKKHEITGE